MNRPMFTNLVFTTVILSSAAAASNYDAGYSIHQSNPDFNFEKPPGRTSYFDTLRKSKDILKGFQLLRTNETSRESINDVLSDLSYFELLRNVHSFEELGIKTDVKETVLVALQQVLKEASSKAAFTDSPGSQLCINDTGRTVKELLGGTPWAIQMFDSTGKPGPSLTEGRLTFVGNYQQCRDVNVPADPAMHSGAFKGSFVYLMFYLKQALQIRWSVCLPDSCSAGQVYMLVNDTITAYLKSGALIQGMPTIIDNQTEMTTATYATIIIFSIIAALMVLGTLYDIIVIQLPLWDQEKMTAEKIGLATNRLRDESHGYRDASILGSGAYILDEKSPLMAKTTRTTEQGAGIKALLAFSVYTNTKKFLTTAQAPGALTAIHGIRFLSMTWVMLGHFFAFGMEFFDNQQDIQQFLERWTFDAVVNAFPSVDTFYTLSGLLTAYLTVKELIKIKSLKINWGLFYFHRFWRLTPPYMLTLMACLGLSQYLGSGAMWAPTQPTDKHQCENYWWRNLLYINTLTPLEDICFGHSWYLSNDMMFFIISPIVMIPFFFSTMAGVITSMAGLTIHWALTGALSNDRDWPTTPLSHGVSQAVGADYQENYYFKPYTRIGPYLVGLLIGGLLARKAIPRLNHFTNTIGWLVFSATGLAVVYGLRGDVSGNAINNVDQAALYNALSRSAWGACVCWVIVSCHQGYGGLVNSLMSWSPFVVLGRLTYMSYLVHPNILYAFYQNMETLLYIKDFTMIINYLGVVVLVNMTAFVLMLGLESPMIGLEKALLPGRKKE